MRAKTTAALLGAAALGSAFFLPGGATAAQLDSATGGGQILADTEGGAGDTIAFTARATADGARGQVQYVDRTGSTGKGQIVQHGTVACIEVDGNTARISGVWTSGPNADVPFGLFVVDNGEGTNAGSDVVTVVPEEMTCDFDVEDDDQIALARGNAQVRDAG